MFFFLKIIIKILTYFFFFLEIQIATIITYWKNDVFNLCNNFSQILYFTP